MEMPKAGETVDKPRIIIGGVEYEPMPPTMFIWRRTVEVMEKSAGELSEKERFDILAAYIVEAIARPEVTAETLERALPIRDFLPLAYRMMRWVYGQIYEPLQKIPNEPAPPGD